MSTPHVGDQVRLAVEGRVTDAWYDANDAPYLEIEVVGGDGYHSRLPMAQVGVEILPPPEPEWQPGDVGACEHGYSYLRSFDQNWIAQDGTVSASECARRLVVRKGKPVTSP